RLERFFCFLLRSSVCPDHPAHFFHVQMFGERRRRRHSEKSKETVQGVRRRGDEVAITLHYLRRFAQVIEDWPGIERVDRMQPKCKRGYDTEIAATTAKRPEQIGIFTGIGLYKFTVCQYHVGREQIIDGQSAFAREMADAAAERQSANAGGGDDSAG